ncbi:zinc finger MYM-type protein 1-like [Anolis carolinensis]|nr:PREDICTED: zinc finger MYM-type protein 1-like [Anolis carolinensis]XP_008116038.1 PREDICTED: zinc finger MYM-type protein 1-like [Anolis carolinensis]|eukprot:XP_008113471.1 PREDICTED: zinc finger MYM-type protein 1-like [Anolis carolinensis]
MSSKKKPSGAFHRKRRLQHSQEDKSQAKALKRFFTTSPSCQTGKPETTKLTESDHADDGKIPISEPLPGPSTSQDLLTATSAIPLPPSCIGITGTDTEDVDEDSLRDAALPSTSRQAIESEQRRDPLLFLSNDCGEWPLKITDEARKIIVERGPQQVRGIKFPKDIHGRKFSPFHYSRKLCNGERVNRYWLQYSVSKNAVFCITCKIFGNDTSSLAGSQGFSNWRNLSRLLSSHEKSRPHMENRSSWRELSQRLHLNKTIDAEHERLINAEIKHWDQILKRLLCATRFLGVQGLPFRGTKDVLFEPNNGNFLKLIEHIAQFDDPMAEHVRRITSKETHVHYLSKNVQNEFISFLAGKVQNNILEQLHEATYYSIILDCTPDISNTEQMTLVVRFVTCKANEDILIKEHFLGFVPVASPSGEGMTEILLHELEARRIPLKNMRGQGYDNGSAMKGKHVGVQRRILDLNPRAFYVPCGNHSLNLVINDAAMSCKIAADCFATVQDLYNLFSGSPVRWGTLLKHVSTLTLKPLSSTRWESRIEALLPLRFHIEEVYDAVYEASHDQKFDGLCRSRAGALLKRLQSFTFLCSIVTWHEILHKINIVSKQLQKVSIDLQNSMALIKSVKSFLERMRSEEGLNSIITDAKELAEKIDATADFENEQEARPRKVSRQFSYECKDEAVHSGKESFKVNFFFVVLDTAISSLKERFQLMDNHSGSFKFLYDISSLGKCWNEKELKYACQRLETVLTDGEDHDVNAGDLYTELQLLADMLPPGSLPADALSFINHGSEDVFPNVYTALRILLTLPISVASGERSFSKLKLIKNYLRSTLSQERLSGLSTLAIENSLLDDMDTDSLVHEFSKLKVRKIRF